MNGITDEQKKEIEEKGKQGAEAGENLRKQIVTILKEELPQIFRQCISDGRITLPYNRDNRRL